MQVTSSSFPSRYYNSNSPESSEESSLKDFIVPDNYVEYVGGYQPQASEASVPTEASSVIEEESEESTKPVSKKKRSVQEALKDICEKQFKGKLSKQLETEPSHKTRSGLSYRDERELHCTKKARVEDKDSKLDDTTKGQTPEVTKIRFESIRKIPKQVGPHECNVVGRDKEVIQIIRMLAQPKGGGRPLLLGPAGIGKKSIVRKVADWIDNKQCPDSLQGRSVYLIDCIPLLANELTAIGRQELGVELRKLIENIIRRQHNPILFFRDIDRIIELEFVTDFLQALLRTPVNVIASISDDPSSEEINRAMKILGNYNFMPMVVGELSKEDSKLVARHKLQKYPLPQNLEITEEGIQFAVNASGDYLKKQKFPMKTLSLIREAANDVLLKRAGEKKGGSEVNVQKKMELTPFLMAKVLQEQTGIEAEELVSSSWDNLVRIHKRLSERIIGQNYAINTVCDEINNYKLGLCDKKKPWGVFLFVGSTGVGKTELAKSVTKELFHEDRCFIRLDMTEFAESHTISKLIGAPPGYVGHDDGGKLCKALKETPYCVILCDEIEKAHPDVRRVFLQIMDEGRLTDGRGTTVDCTNALIIMTSNLGAKELLKVSDKKHLDTKVVLDTVQDILVKELSPEFFNRLKVVPFSSLRREQYPEVINAHLKSMQERYLEEKNIALSWDESVIQYFLKQDHDPKFGMRNLCRFVELSIKGALREETFARKQQLDGAVRLKVQKDKIIVAE